MKPYLVKTPKFVQRLYPKRIWAFPNKNNSIFLTFDDGPIPEVTPWVLDTLKNYNAKATFFCIGDNIKKYPEVFSRIISEKHAFGNHTNNHLNGWKTNIERYVINCEKFEEILRSYLPLNHRSTISNLFRPPFGKLSYRQSKILREKGYKIIMWDVLSADFDKNISKEKCLENVLNNIQEGSIVVFHDSLKSEEKLKYVLPKVLDFITNKKWDCARINLN